ncbi:sigma-70 family RNA polymerase sigma factor [Achromobacter pestifer]|uniref:Putative RNA polymerase sigma factor FecI n=1 Tax=Achromobacter pestifer TaxID=1353889 RepID=A0A6S6ZI47_9BURK|nr:sigma-70 family RNA polymerase sigma factor [Achromobacter pestifer]CAB3676947.1 putative RNA polymerase sigma factor FecI [Achromobacter pestifer]
MPSLDRAQHDALRDLYRTHHGWLLGWLRRKLGCAFDAADCAHDTFFRLLGNNELAQLQTPRAYLTTVATRLIVDRARRRKIEVACLESWATLYGQASTPSSESLVQAVQALDALAALLHTLPEKPRTAFLLHRLDGLTHAQIAEQLGISASMVKQYIASALVHCYTATFGAPATGSGSA